MNRVYLITEGEYSDYRIITAFSSEAMAQDFINEFGNHYDIEEYDLDVNYAQMSRNGYLLYEVKMLRNGDVVGIVGGVNREPSTDWGYIVRHTYEDGYLIQYAWARSPEHAIKITNEKRAMLIANGEWD